jgi:hypothetical protein
VCVCTRERASVYVYVCMCDCTCVYVIVVVCVCVYVFPALSNSFVLCSDFFFCGFSFLAQLCTCVCAPSFGCIPAFSCGYLSPECVDAIALRCANTLQSLDLSECKRVSSSSVSLLLRTCQRLSVLSLAHCRDVTDDALADLSPTIQSLDVTGCYQLTNEFLATLASNLRSGPTRLHTLK